MKLNRLLTILLVMLLFAVPASADTPDDPPFSLVGRWETRLEETLCATILHVLPNGVFQHVSEGVTVRGTWTQEDYEAATILKPANATGSVMMTQADGVYSAVIDRIPAKELNSGIYVAAGYSYGGVSYCTGVLPYSIGAYCASQISKGAAVAALAEATAVYGYHAKQYFG